MKSNIIELSRKLFPKRIDGFFALINNLKSNPYSLRTKFFLPESISDFFVWSPFPKKTIFLAENIRALIKGEKVKVTHFFRFYSMRGNLISEESHESDDYFCRIEIMKSANCSEYCSFTHHVEANEKNQEELFTSQLKQNKKFVCEQNRGYCIYYPNIESSLGATVHGNFGGITKNNIKLAKQRVAHLYTPAYILKSNNYYDLVFNNPTEKKIKVKVIFNFSDLFKEIFIEPLGTYPLRVSDYMGSLTFESRLPICRPIIFKNSECRAYEDFDVLHA